MKQILNIIVKEKTEINRDFGKVYYKINEEEMKN